MCIPTYRYLQERLYLCRELLTDTGSIFVQISDENVHRLRCLMDEVFGASNFVALIPFRKKTMPFGTTFLEQMADFLVWYSKRKFSEQGTPNAKFHPFFLDRLMTQFEMMTSTLIRMRCWPRRFAS